MSIGARLKQWRLEKQLKQSEAGALFGIHHGTYQKYELNIQKPGADAIEAFVNAGINANWLLTDLGPMLVADYSATIAPATELTEPMGVLDTKRLQLAIQTIEEVLTENHRVMEPDQKANAISLAYQIYEEEDKEKDRAGFNHASKILNRLIKSMA